MAHTVLITGANRGLGLEMARIFADRGDRVLAAVRDPASATDVAGFADSVHALDTGDPQSIESFARHLGSMPIDILVNNAGVMGDDKPLGKLSFSEFRRVFDTNVFGPAVLSQTLLPHLKLGGRKLIVNISSEVGSSAANWPGFSYAYSASKAALNRISAQMGKELRKEGVQVVAFCPGWNKTSMGGSGAQLDPRESMIKLVATIDKLTPSDTGKFLRTDGTTIPY